MAKAIKGSKYKRVEGARASVQCRSPVGKAEALERLASIDNIVHLLIKDLLRNFSVVKNPFFHCRWLKFDPWLKIPHTSQCGLNK